MVDLRSSDQVVLDNTTLDLSEQLQQHRAYIDQLDTDILRCLSQRAMHAQAIGQLKQGAVYRPEREAQVLRAVMSANQGPLSNEGVARIFREVMSQCLALEKPMTVACLGPEGTFSEAALVKHFGDAVKIASLPTIDEVFQATERGDVDYAVVPVENSTEGAVGRTLDLLVQTSLNICGEVMLRVEQCLMTKTGSLDGIECVYSHPQSLAQTQRWLLVHASHLKQIPVSSNAEAARCAAQEPQAAAIGSRAAAIHYDLGIVEANIEDETNNTTRFLVLGSQSVARSGRDKTSFVLSVQNRPGAIFELLAPLATHQVSMTRFESRPSKKGLWEYVFFIDVDGHVEDNSVRCALEAISLKAGWMRSLGSYPSAVY